MRISREWGGRDTGFMRDISFGVACYLLGLLGLAGFALLVIGLGWGWMPPRFQLEGPWPWIVNGSWIFLFGLQHSGMARRRFKDGLGGWFPRHLERSLYVAVLGLVLLGLVLTWQALPGGALWEGPIWLAGVGGAGALGVVVCSYYFDHLEFFGLRQAWTGREAENGTFIVSGPYRLVRHPLMLSLLLFLWGQPVMPMTLAILSGGLTVYVLAAIRWEERDLIQKFGGDYLAYRAKVPALVPWRGWVK